MVAADEFYWMCSVHNPQCSARHARVEQYQIDKLGFSDSFIGISLHLLRIWQGMAGHVAKGGQCGFMNVVLVCTSLMDHVRGNIDDC